MKTSEKTLETSVKKESPSTSAKEEIKFIEKKKRNRKKSNESSEKMKSSSSNFNEISSFSQSENEASKKRIFKTFKASRQQDSQIEMKKMMRLMKNRLSARKCRHKKKIYLGRLEDEIAELKSELEKFKSMEKKEKHLESMIRIIEKKEKEILSLSNITNDGNLNLSSNHYYKHITLNSNANSGNSQNKKKLDSYKKEFLKIQKNLLSELLKKFIKNSFPIDFKIVANKFIKIKEIEINDDIDDIIYKINENIEILGGICNIHGIQSRVINNPDLNNYLPVKMLNFYVGLQK